MPFALVQLGGALYVEGNPAVEEKVELSHCDFRSNNALKRSERFDTGLGGAISMIYVTGVKIRSSTFSNNRAVCLQTCTLHRPSSNTSFACSRWLVAHSFEEYELVHKHGVDEEMYNAII